MRICQTNFEKLAWVHIGTCWVNKIENASLFCIILVVKSCKFPHASLHEEMHYAHLIETKTIHEQQLLPIRILQSQVLQLVQKSHYNPSLLFVYTLWQQVVLCIYQQSHQLFFLFCKPICIQWVAYQEVNLAHSMFYFVIELEFSQSKHHVNEHA